MFRSVLLFALVATTEAYSTGAPPTACNDQVPNHSGGVRPDNGGYSTSSGAYTCYAYGGQIVDVTLTAAITGFRGILMSVSPTLTLTPRHGTWVNFGALYHLVCVQSLTHSDASTKSGFRVYQWKPIAADPCNTGAYTIKTTVVRDFTLFYMITSTMPEDIYGGLGPGRVFATGNCPGGLDFGIQCQQCAITIEGLPTYVFWSNGTCNTGTALPACDVGMVGYTIFNDTAYVCTQTLSEFVCHGHGTLDSLVPRQFNDTSGNCTCNAPYTGARCDGCIANYRLVNGTCVFNGTVPSSSTGGAAMSSSSTGQAASSTGPAASSTGQAASSTGQATSSTGAVLSSSTGIHNASACVPNPCQHGGVCRLSRHGHALCTCRDGWSGRYCQDRVEPIVQVEFDFGPEQLLPPELPLSPLLPPPPLPPAVPGNGACQSRPCNNGAQCVQASTAAGYVCICAEGFTGPRCSERVPCGGPCRHRGICNELSQQCECVEQWKGAHCEQPDDRVVCAAFGHCRPGLVCTPIADPYLDDNDVSVYPSGMYAMCL